MPEFLKSRPPFKFPVCHDFALRSNATSCVGYDLELADKLNANSDYTLSSYTTRPTSSWRTRCRSRARWRLRRSSPSRHSSWCA